MTDYGRQQNREQTHGREHHACKGGRVTHVLLQPQGQQHGVAEEGSVGKRHGEGGGPEIAVAEQTEIDDRMPFGEFPNQKDEQSDGRHDGERHDLPGLEPVEILALVEQNLQRPHPNTRSAKPTLSIGTLTVGVSRLR